MVRYWSKIDPSRRRVCLVFEGFGLVGLAILIFSKGVGRVIHNLNDSREAKLSIAS